MTMLKTTDSHLGALIALDWGTSSLRAYLLGNNGEVIDTRSGEDGILAAGMDFEAVFEKYVGNWLVQKPDLPVIASGMIGSRQGWIEVPYIELPAGLNEIAKGLKTYTTRNGVLIRFVPGISTTANALPDVMRGEETQVFGALNTHNEENLFVLPGTHSKWVRVYEGQIIDFRTFMTGELFQALRHHTILGRLMRDDVYDTESFVRGVLQIGTNGTSSENLMSSLFSVRTLGLFEQVDSNCLASYLSGLLIGAELQAAQCLGVYKNSLTPILVGSDELISRYALAFSTLGQQSRIGDKHAAPLGLLSIAKKIKVLA